MGSGSIIARTENLLGEFARRFNAQSESAERNGGKHKLSLVIYTKPGCPYCQQARDYYNSKGVAFIDYDAQNDRARRAEMFKYSNEDPTVPCIVEDGKYLGSGWGNPPRG
jgi:glutaredoxin